MVGGFAAVAHGVTQLTQDIDICCRMTPDNLMRLQDALSDLHPVHRMPPERPSLQLTPETAAEFRNLYLETDWGQLDCLGEILGVGGYDAVLAQSVEIELPGSACRLLAIRCPRSREASDGAGQRSRDHPPAPSHPGAQARVLTG